MAHGLRISLVALSVITAGGMLVPRHLLVSASRGLRRFAELAQQRPKLILALTVAGALVPAIYFASWIAHYGVAVPKMDDWDVAMLISRAHRGQMTFADLFEQQQEGRTLIPRLVFLLSTAGGRWDVRDLMWLTVLTSWLTAAGIFLLLRKSGLSMVAMAITLWVSVLLIFTPAQYEIMTFAFGFPSFLPAFFLVVALIVIDTSLSISAKFVMCAALAIASSFTLPHGMLAWGLTFPVLFLQEPITRWRRWLGAWLVACAGCAVVYFWGYQKPEYLPQFAPAVASLDYARFIVVFLGNAMELSTKSHLASAATFGCLTLSVFTFAGGYVVVRRNDRTLLRRCAPWLALGSCAIGSACLAALGRISYGVPYALASRYVTFSLYLPVATVVLAAIIGTKSMRQGTLRWPLLCAFAIVLLAGGFFYLRAAGDALYFLRANSTKDRLGRAALQFSSVIDTSAAVAKSIYPAPNERVPQLAQILDAQRLLRPALVHTNRMGALPHRLADGTVAAGVWENRSGSDPNIVHASGWTAMLNKNRPADAVLLAYSTTDDDWTAFAMSDAMTMRNDIARRFRRNGEAYQQNLIWSGWTATFPRSAIPAGARISAWAVDSDGPILYRLEEKEAPPKS